MSKALAGVVDAPKPKGIQGMHPWKVLNLTFHSDATWGTLLHILYSNPMTQLHTCTSPYWFNKHINVFVTSFYLCLHSINTVVQSTQMTRKQSSSIFVSHVPVLHEKPFSLLLLLLHYSNCYVFFYRQSGARRVKRNSTGVMFIIFLDFPEFTEKVKAILSNCITLISHF